MVGQLSRVPDSLILESLGDVVYLQVFGQVIVVLSSLPAIKDLLEKRGEKYADRPTLPIQKMYATPGHLYIPRLASLTPSKSRLDLDWLIPTCRVGEYWREGRRLLDRSLGPGATTAYRRMMEDNTRLFLGQLLETPGDFFSHIGLSVRPIDLCILPLTFGQSSREIDHVPHVWV
jgi:hypothetical protein